MMAKTNSGLVSFCKTALRAGTGYVFGTYGQVCTEALLDQQANLYPNQAGGEYRKIGEKWMNKRVVDCSGLIKYYMMSIGYGKDPTYNPNYDQNADTMYNQSINKGDMSIIPEIPGLLLHKPGHVGVYIGNNKVIEAYGTAKGVIQSDLPNGNWDHWYEYKSITYSGTVVKIDTTMDVVKNNGETYVFKTTSQQTPSVTVGTGGVVSLSHVSRIGYDDFWKITFIGQSGQSAGIYTAGPGEQPLKRFVARIS